VLEGKGEFTVQISAAASILIHMNFWEQHFFETILQRLKQIAHRKKALLQGDRCCSSFSARLSCHTKIFGTKHLIKEMPSLMADGTSHPNL